MKIPRLSNQFGRVFIRVGLQSIPIALFCITCLISGYFATIGVDPHHDGIVFKPAMDVASGNVLFRETFSEFNVLATILQASALILFGNYLLTIKLLTAFFYGLISVLLYTIFKKIVPTFLAVCTVLLWIFSAPYFLWTFLPWPTVYALFFLLLSCYFLILSLNKKNEFLFTVLSGICAALTFWTRQNIGLILCTLFSGFFFYTWMVKSISWKKCVQQLIAFFWGMSFVSLIILSLLWINGALTDWWKQSFLFPYYWGRITSGTYGMSLIIRGLFPTTYSQSTLSLWLLMPMVSIGLFLTHTIRIVRSPKSSSNFIVIALVAAGMAAWIEYYPIVCYRHVYWGATPMFGLLTLFIYEVSRYICTFVMKKRKFTYAAHILACIILLIVFFPEVSYRIQEGIKKIRAHYVITTYPTVLKNMRIPTEESKFYTGMANAIQRYLDIYPKRNVLNLSMDALYLTFDPRIKNIHPFYINGAGYAYYIYPDFWNIMEKYWKSNLPIMITSGQFIPPVYCKPESSPEMFDTYIIVPCQE